MTLITSSYRERIPCDLVFASQAVLGSFPFLFWRWLNE